MLLGLLLPGACTSAACQSLQTVKQLMHWHLYLHGM
jgi:hypothetical protein